MAAGLSLQVPGLLLAAFLASCWGAAILNLEQQAACFDFVKAHAGKPEEEKFLERLKPLEEKKFTSMY